MTELFTQKLNAEMAEQNKTMKVRQSTITKIRQFARMATYMTDNNADFVIAN